MITILSPFLYVWVDEQEMYVCSLRTLGLSLNKQGRCSTTVETIVEIDDYVIEVWSREIELE